MFCRNMSLPVYITYVMSTSFYWHQFPVVRTKITLNSVFAAGARFSISEGIVDTEIKHRYFDIYRGRITNG